MAMASATTSRMASRLQPVGGGARGAAIDHRPHRKVRAALRHVLMDGVVGEARQRLVAAGDDGFDFGDAERARGIHHLPEEVRGFRIIPHTRSRS